MPTNCVWVDNLADTVQEKFLFRQFNRYGPVSNMVIDRERGKALIFFSSLESAQFALSEMRNRILNGQKIQVISQTCIGMIAVKTNIQQS